MRIRSARAGGWGAGNCGFEGTGRAELAPSASEGSKGRDVPTRRWRSGLVHLTRSSERARVLVLLILTLPAGCHTPPRTPAAAPERISLFEQFLLEEPGDDWALRTPELWRIAREGDRGFLQMAIPPDRPMLPGVRRPQEYALYAPYQFRSFSLSVRVRADRDPSVLRRDAVLIFGWQDDTHFYYAHLSGLTDEWHNALVRVDGQTRTSLVPPASRPPPTLTDTAWHKVDILRDVAAGTIEVYVDAYDENAKPVFRVTDRTYKWGHIGLGSFDDHASFASVKIEGEARRAPRPQLATGPARLDLNLTLRARGCPSSQQNSS